MVRPSAADLVHEVDLFPIATGGGSDGTRQAEPLLARPAIVDEKQRLVRDQRTGDGHGAEVSSSGIVFLFLEDYVKPGSDVLIRKGTPAERRANVIAVAYYDHPEAPEHVELFLD